MTIHYQKQARTRNRDKIIQLLTEKPRTFSELLKESSLSRAVVADHLKTLEKEGLVKKVYDSEKRRVLNVLQVGKLDLVEWFFHQVENLDMPKETLDKGRKLLSQSFLLNSAVAYSYVWNNILEILGDYSKSGEGETLFKFMIISPKLKVPAFQLEGKDQESVRRFLSDLSPQALTMVLTEYVLEKSLFAGTAAKTLKKREEFFYAKLSKDMKESFDTVSEWWFNEVVEYLPSGNLMRALTCVFSNAFSKLLQETTNKLLSQVKVNE